MARRSRMRRVITKRDWNSFISMVERANRAQLGDIKQVVDHEINVSEKVIAEGFEKRGKTQLIKKWGTV